MSTFNKTDLRRAEAPSGWCIRAGGNNGMKLTYFQTTTHDAVSNKKTLAFNDKSKSFGTVASQGIEVVIDGYLVDSKTNILYVIGENSKFYRLLMGNSLKSDTVDGVIQRLHSKNIQRLDAN
jgi:hypothetical protein